MQTRELKTRPDDVCSDRVAFKTFSSISRYSNSESDILNAFGAVNVLFGFQRSLNDP